MHKGRSNPNAYVKPIVVTTGEVLARYRLDGYPDQKKQPRPEAMRSAEEANCQTLEEFWASINAEEVPVEAMTGLRTAEVLQLRTDAGPYEPRWITPDGKSLCVRRGKGEEAVNPFVTIRDELWQTLDALFRWKC